VSLSLPRRRLLKWLGLSSAASLPVFRPGKLMAQAASTTPNRFFGFALFAGGTQQENFWPKTTATEVSLATTPLPKLLESFEPFKSKMLILRGLKHAANLKPLDSHSRGLSTVFTGISPLEPPATTLPIRQAGQGTSIDQHISGLIGTSNKFKSLEFGFQTNGDERVAWAGPLQGLPAQKDPYAMFDRIFANFAPPGDPAAAALFEQQRARNKSMLDFIAGELTGAAPLVGADDRVRLEAHLETIRGIERRLGAGAQAGAGCSKPEPGTKLAITPANGDQLYKLAMDLIVAAFACDLTRVVTFLSSRYTKYPWLGAGEHHEISHVGGSDTTGPWYTINRWQWDQIAYLYTKLAAIPAGDGKTLFDHTLTYFSTDNGNGKSHSIDDVPTMIVGDADGYLKTGRYLAFTGRTSNDALISVVNAFGSKVTTYGNPAFCHGALPLT
jgi:Protein of unknown function (DUF1552)